MAVQIVQEKRGYRKLAAWMSPRREAAIFRKFNDLNVLRLLSMQAELIDLESQYNDACDDDDRSSDPDRSFYTRSFKQLNSSENPQKKLFDDIKIKVRDYNEALFQVAALEKLTTPSKSSLESLRDTINENMRQHDFPRLREKRAWNQEYEKELVLASDSEKRVAFSRFFERRLLTPLYQCLGARDRGLIGVNDLEAGVGHFKEDTLIQLTKIIGTILATLLPIASMVLLYLANTIKLRFGLMAIFTGTFSAALTLFTAASTTEVYASTAAFAAVEVVFIGSTLKGQ